MSKNNKGTNMIKLCIYFHTKQGDFQLPPKMAFPRGKISMPTNHKHGIRASDVNDVYFSKSQNNLMGAIKECLKKQRVKIIQEDKIKDFKKFLQMQQNEEFFNKEMDL